MAARITSARCDRDVQITGTARSERWTINVIAQYSATNIAIDDDWHALVSAPVVIAIKVPWKDGRDDGSDGPVNAYCSLSTVPRAASDLTARQAKTMSPME